MSGWSWARAWPGIAAAAIALVAFLVVLAVDDRSAESPTVEATPRATAEPTPESTPAVAPTPGSTVEAASDPTAEATPASMVEAGRRAYALHCAVCHGDDLEGGIAPSLAGPELSERYGAAIDLYDYIRDRMPAGGVGPGGLMDIEYLRITAFILNARGVLDADIDLTIDLANDTSLTPGDASPSTAMVVPAPTPRSAPVLTPAASGNTPPQAPTLVEPATALLREGLSPIFVTLQTGPFVDADSDDRHTATEFGIWELHHMTRVWTAMVTADPLDQATLERGVFQGPLAGRMGLDHKTIYAIRARHRDASGDPLSEWSTWSDLWMVPTAEPGEPIVKPMRVRDIQPHSLRWQADDGAPVALPEGATLRIASPVGDLLEITGAASGRAVRDFAPTERYASVFFTFEAGPNGLEIPASELSFLDATGVRRFAWLPWLRLDPGAVLIAASTASGAFHFEPDDTRLDRADTEPKLFAHSQARAPAVPWRVREGFRVELVAGGFALPVQIAAAPEPADGLDAPVAYVTELYGSVKALGRDGSLWTYATNILNEQPSAPITEFEGEAGTSGIAVDPRTGDVYVTTTYRVGDDLYNKIVRLESDDGGRTAARVVDVLRMEGEPTGPSHQIHGLLFGHDDKLYVAVGDGAVVSMRGLDDAYFGGKVLRLNRDGGAPADNPHFDPEQPDAPVSFQWAKGLRNFVALAQRPADDALYTAENGFDIDRLLRLEAGQNYGYAGTDSSLMQRGLWFFSPDIAPVGVAFAIGGAFPADRQGHLYVGAFGRGFVQETTSVGKEIWEIELDATGAVVGRPTTFVKYVGDGAGPITGVAYMPDGLYFLEFTADIPQGLNPEPTGRLWRVVPDVG